MEPEKESSSSPQKLASPLGLLGILALSFGWFVSRLFGPEHESGDAQHPHNTTISGQGAASPLHVIVDGVVPPIPTPDKKRETREENTERRDKRRLRVEVLTLFALCVYTIVNFGMWYAARQSASAAIRSTQQAERTMRIDQRAWVRIGTGSEVFTINQPIIVNLLIGNSGKTPAKDVTGDMVVQLLKETEEPDFIYAPGHPRMHLPKILILPNTEAHSPLKVQYDPPGGNKPVAVLYSQKLKDQIENGTLLVVVHGRLTYDDVFGRQHWLKFCTFGGHNLEGRGPASCDEYNDTDDNNN